MWTIPREIAKFRTSRYRVCVCYVETLWSICYVETLRLCLHLNPKILNGTASITQMAPATESPNKKEKSSLNVWSVKGGGGKWGGVRMRIVKIKDRYKNTPILATRKHPNSGQQSKCWSQLPLSHTKLVHMRARERKRDPWPSGRRARQTILTAQEYSWLCLEQSDMLVHI